MAIVECWTQEQQDAFKGEHELSSPKPWVVKDGRLIYSFCDTEEEAKRIAAELDRDDKVAERFRDWLSDIATEFSVPEETIENIVQGLVESR